MEINEIPLGAVVVGVDGTDHSDRAIDEAVQKADAEGRDLILVHSLDDAASVLALIGHSEPTHYLREIKEAGEQVLAAGMARAGGGRGRRATVLATTDPRIALIDASQRASAIFLGSRGRGPVRALLLGSVSVAVARHAACPVVVVRPHDPGTSSGVLVGTDASQGSLPVLEFAYRCAAELAAPLTVLHAVWDPPAPPAAAGERSPFPEGELALSEALAGLADEFPDVKATGCVVWGDPAAAILDAAGNVQLVVVGRGASSGSSLRRAGALAIAVVEHARTSVAVVPQN